MDEIHFRSLSKKWSFKLREDAQDIEQEIIIFYLARQSESKNLDIFEPGNEGALFELLKHKIRGNNLESVGGSGRSLAAAGDDADADAYGLVIEDELESPDEKAEQLEKRLHFEQVFCEELDQIDELNHLAGSDLGEAFGFTGANGRAILAQLKKQIVDSAQKRFNANARLVKRPARAKAQQRMASA